MMIVTLFALLLVLKTSSYAKSMLSIMGNNLVNWGHFIAFITRDEFDTKDSLQLVMELGPISVNKPIVK